MTRTLIAFCLGLCTLAPPSHAADFSFYAGGGAGSATTGVELSIPGTCPEACIPENPIVPPETNSDSSSDTAFKVVAGVRVGRFLGLEAAYTDVQSSTYTVVHPIQSMVQIQDSDFSSLSIALLGYVPIHHNIELLARAGSTRAEVSGTRRREFLFIPFVPIPSIPPERVSEKDLGFAYGAGVQARFGRVSLRLEYEGHDVSVMDETYAVTLGATWTLE